MVSMLNERFPQGRPPAGRCGPGYPGYRYFRAPEGTSAPVDGMPAIFWVPDINGDYTPVYLDIDEDTY